MRGAPHTVYTIGHSTRSIDEFVSLLRESDVDILVDVRSIPRSRTNPQFNTDVLPVSLAAAKIGYRHIAALGGRRHRAKGAPEPDKTLWKVQAFQNYAMYTHTAEFRAGLTELETLAAEHHCAIMCAEAVWWRCHRRIIADALLADDLPVMHIMGPGKIVPATITPGAQVRDGIVDYSVPTG